MATMTTSSEAIGGGDEETFVNNQAHDTKNQSSSMNPNKEVLIQTIACIDRIMLGLGDTPLPRRRCRKRNLPQQLDSTTAAAATSLSTSSSSSSSTSHYAPLGLEKEFQELYSILYPCLVDRTTKDHTNVAAILMGNRGSGKTLLLERCLECLEQQIREANKPMFRVVTLHGLMIRGDHVGHCIKEITQQLSDIAEQESRTKTKIARSHRHRSRDDDDGTNNNDNNNNEASSPEAHPTLEKWLRIRKNFSFSSNLSLLDETLRLACADQTPILIVLDELDTFVMGNASTDMLSGASVKEGISKTARPVLLYHLLDRIATKQSMVSLVAMTSSLSALQSLEKRVKSRADGSSKIIHLHNQQQSLHPPLSLSTSTLPPPVLSSTSYETHVAILLSKLDDVSNDESDKDNSNANGILQHLRQQVTNLICIPTTAANNRLDDNDDGNTGNDDDNNDNEQRCLIQQIMTRQHALGKDMRWFCRVFFVALSLFREDCHDVLMDYSHSSNNNIHNNSNSSSNNQEQALPPTLEPQYFLQAMTTMGASLPPTSTLRSSSSSSSSLHDPQHNGGIRMQILLDLSQPQVALLLAARRILSRDALQEHNVLNPLTLDRMLQEYESFRSAQKPFSRPLLRHAFFSLLQYNVLRPSADHSGGGPLQYLHQDQLYTNNMDMTTLSRLPLHLPTEIERELKLALHQNLLDCTTALREWGRNSN